ncbi:MAG: hypothetical protein ACRET0_01175 [Steroidobacteraceae bacterium]
MHILTVDVTCRPDHCFLEAADCCRFLAEYHPGRGSGDRFRQLIADFKCPPSVAALSPARLRRKRRAVATLAQALRAALARSTVEAATWVPIPPSSAEGDPDYDDRLLQTLRAAFAGCDLDLRLLLRQTGNMSPDHRAGTRIPREMLYARLRLDAAALALRPLRTRIILFDDLLVSGKHYKCCQRRLRESLPAIPISGWFIARRVLPLRWRAGPRR